MNALYTLVAEIQDDIFAYRLDSFAGSFLKLVDLLVVEMQGLTPQEQVMLNPVLNAILAAYERKDYLLIADLLEFELRPLVVME